MTKHHHQKNEEAPVSEETAEIREEPKEAEMKTAGGLYIPDTAKEKPSQGTVIAVGPGKKDEPMEVKCGDTILFGKYAGNEVHFEDKKYLIMKQSDIMAIIG